MIPLVDSSTMAAIDRHAIQELGLPGAVLMETAGRGVFLEILKRFGPGGGRPVSLVCGTGNNGGDGFVAGRCLLGEGYKPVVHLLGRREEVGGEAKTHLDAYLAFGGEFAECAGKERKPALSGAALIVDAIFGTGLRRDVAGVAAKWIMAMNRARVPVVSVDIPSGISADDGRIMGVAVRADLTVTFGHYKKGLFFYPGSTLAGEVVLVDIGLPRATPAHSRVDLVMAEEKDFRGAFIRNPDSHKGHYGHLALVAGGRGRMGAAALAAFASLKSGAGLATALFPAGLTGEARFAPEVMTAPLGSGSPGPVAWTPALFDSASSALASCDAAVVGPGMGTDREAEEFLELLLSPEARSPLVLDADALTILARRADLRPRVSCEDVLTPHPGEAGRLLGRSGEDVQAAREECAAELAARFGCTAVLKGRNTLVAAKGQPTRLIPRGNPGMATAGSGDVLAGVVGAFLARGLPPFEAAAAAAWVHGAAGDLAAREYGMEGLTGGDILARLPEAMKTLGHQHENSKETNRK